MKFEDLNEDGSSKAMFLFSSRDSDDVFILHGAEAGFDAPGYNKSTWKEQLANFAVSLYIATILYRYTGEPKVEGDLNKFPDVKEISSFAATAMICANQEGIINGVTVNGVNKLAPKDSTTREQIASIIMRFIEG